MTYTTQKHKQAAALATFNSMLQTGLNQLCSTTQVRVSVSGSTCANAVGAKAIYERLLNTAWNCPVLVSLVGCNGACYAEPFIDIRLTNGVHYLFGKVDHKMLWYVINAIEGAKPTKFLWCLAKERTLGQLKSINDLQIVHSYAGSLDDFWQPQTKRITSRCGIINPASIAEYIATDGYSALKKVLFSLSPVAIIDLVDQSGLRGRGGAGFPTGQKWRTAQKYAADSPAIVIANADEGDPGAYMDRIIMESDPYSIIEGLTIAGYTIGASQGYIFIRHEYSQALATLHHAIDESKRVNLLGNAILGTNYNFDITLIESAGAFICGEETALLEAIEGKRANPRARPPYPAQCGLHKQPTLINNVETLANITWLLQHDPIVYKELGIATSTGTKLFCLTGDVKRTGVIEVPLGIAASTIFEKIGGIRKKKTKAIHIGGPSGGILPYQSDISLDFASIAAKGIVLGSGGLIALNFRRCLVDFARHHIEFMAEESCGRCTICRDGLMHLNRLLNTLIQGKAPAGIIEEIDDLSNKIAQLARCGLGKTSVNTLLTTLHYFRSEYLAHTKRICPAIFCKAMINFEIIQAKCRDCRSCYTVCPSGAVIDRSGKNRYFVNLDECIRCWACYETCPFACIRSTSGEYDESNVCTQYQ